MSVLKESLYSFYAYKSMMRTEYSARQIPEEMILMIMKSSVCNLRSDCSVHDILDEHEPVLDLRP